MACRARAQAWGGLGHLGFRPARAAALSEPGPWGRERPCFQDPALGSEVGREVAVSRGALDSHGHPHPHVCSRVAARCAMSSQSAVSTRVYK